MGAKSWRTVVAGNAKRFARRFVPGIYRFMPHVEQYRFDSGIRRQRAPQIYHDPNFIPFRFRGPTVITAHDVSWVRYPEYHPAARLALLRANFPRALERAERVIVVSDFVRDELHACFPVAREKIQVVHNGVSNRFRPHSFHATHDVLTRHGLVHGQYFAAVGTLEPRKNLHTALAAHARLPANVRRKYPLTLIGVEGWLTHSLHAALEHGLREGFVRKLGYVSDDELPLLIAGALAVVYPSVYEGFGLPVVEAMASGVPVLCSTAQALREVAGDAAIMRDPADVEGFSDAMQALIDDGALRKRLIAAGSERARCFSWQRTADETLAVYRQIIA
jgi:alpha-1,3-rhamnosyl/mannosyltransferase